MLEPVTATRELVEAEQVRIGDLVFDVLHLPGHTEGSVCLYEERHALLLTGDVLFAGAFGRVDLPGGSEEQMIASLIRLSDASPARHQGVAGHGAETTIERRAALAASDRGDRSPRRGLRVSGAAARGRCR